MSGAPRLLFVDDEPEILELLSYTFRDFDTDTALNTDSALEILRQRHFDVLVTDIKMPGTPGFMLIDCARQFSPGIVVIVITGHHQEIPEEAKQKVSQWILKPFSLKVIRAAVLGSIDKTAGS
jgi:DNA-binding NtrC family response regulator